MIPENFDIAVCDNTVGKIENITNQKLKDLLLKNKFFILDKNIGSKNIGMGELDELIHVSEKVNFLDYDKVVYFTLRKIVTNPWLFEKVNQMTKDALISNPEFLHLKNDMNFTISPPTENLYNDMFFAIKSNLMKDYVEYSKEKLKFNIRRGVGSEQNLYNFIKGKNMEYEWLDCLGLIRIDYKANNELQLI